MKERGIIFTDEMVRAILDGRKTQTRRLVNSVPTTHDFHGWIMSSACAKDEGKACWAIGDSPLLKDPIRLNCPVGKVGDRLWVRETFGLRVVRDAAGGTGEFITYRASKPDAVYCTCASGSVIPMKWKSPAQMPRRSSRILLEITGVRVERLQDISQEDAQAEGFEGYDDDVSGGMSPYSEFSQAWTDIYGKDSWRENAWVWVIEFKQIQG
ncbi:hypothetical protein JA116_13420 [Morganella morganii]|uniref:hypothetical protein n=1 Tax=Morganella morganii TaxID=582 RepID=UPI000D1E4977|nr:hypothetical protein [Morganella morganii]QXO41662.1 hypothetical protein CXB74_013565 [Morganella morganii]QXO48874.1 hypothetical protein JC861_13485 [Morganella morganii]QXO52737.1 hypothetical protein JC830_13480 [Morganella morganii]QXO60479.1 hypothetical protein JC826_13325 [Morganella morganii]QXO68007.1 hypothetical protein JC792_13330 [Morganella morganii]